MIQIHNIEKQSEKVFLTLYKTEIEQLLENCEKRYETLSQEDFPDDFTFGAAVGKCSAQLEIYRELLIIIKNRLNNTNGNNS